MKRPPNPRPKTMAASTLDWHPSPEDVRRMVAELRPLIAEFAARARTDAGR